VNVIIGLTTRVVIDENIPAKSSGFYMSLRFFFSTFGFIVGPILGTFIVTTYGYGYAFYTSSTIVLVATAYYGFYYQHNKEKQIPKRRNEISLLVSVKRLFTIPTLRTTYLITLLSVFETSGISSFLPIYASARAVGVSLCFSTGVLSIATHSSAAPKGLSGIALGLYGTFEDIGLMVGATVFGLTWAIFGPKSIFVISSGTAIVAALLALTIREDKQ
jgi:predicted MFS family arabinose efflux permease